MIEIEVMVEVGVDWSQVKISDESDCLYTPLSLALVAKAEVGNLRFGVLLDGCLMRNIYMPMTLVHALAFNLHYRFG